MGGFVCWHPAALPPYLNVALNVLNGIRLISLYARYASEKLQNAYEAIRERREVGACMKDRLTPDSLAMSVPQGRTAGAWRVHRRECPALHGGVPVLNPGAALGRPRGKETMPEPAASRRLRPAVPGVQSSFCRRPAHQSISNVAACGRYSVYVGGLMVVVVPPVLPARQ